MSIDGLPELDFPFGFELSVLQLEPREVLYINFGLDGAVPEDVFAVPHYRITSDKLLEVQGRLPARKHMMVESAREIGSADHGNSPSRGLVVRKIEIALERVVGDELALLEEVLPLRPIASASWDAHHQPRVAGFEYREAAVFWRSLPGLGENIKPCNGRHGEQ